MSKKKKPKKDINQLAAGLLKKVIKPKALKNKKK